MLNPKVVLCALAARSTPSLLHKWPKGRFGLLSTVEKTTENSLFLYQLILSKHVLELGSELSLDNYWEVTASRVHPRCTSAHNCFGPVWLGVWNSDHVVLKSSIRTSALPQWQWSDWGLRVTQDAYFSLMTHSKQLLLATFCYTTAGIWVSLRTHRQTDGGGRKDKQTWKLK